jgi:hypothetical protein
MQPPVLCIIRINCIMYCIMYYVFRSLASLFCYGLRGAALSTGERAAASCCQWLCCPLPARERGPAPRCRPRYGARRPPAPCYASTQHRVQSPHSAPCASWRASCISALRRRPPHSTGCMMYTPTGNGGGLTYPRPRHRPSLSCEPNRYRSEMAEFTRTYTRDELVQHDLSAGSADALSAFYRQERERANCYRYYGLPWPTP